MIFKIAPQNLFQKDIQILEAWKPTEDIQTSVFLYMPFYISTQPNMKIVLGS